MTTFTHTGDGADGEGITVTNAPAGSTNWVTVSKGATGVAEYDTARFITGSSSIRFLSTAAADRAYVRWEGFTTDRVSVRCYVFMAAFTGTQTFLSIQGSGSARMCGVAISSAGYLNVTDYDGAVDTASQPLSTSTWYRVEAVVDRTAQTIDVKVFAGNATTHDASRSVSPFNVSVPASGIAIDRVVFGKYTTSSTAEFWLDGFALVTDSTSPIGPVSGGAAHFTLVGNYDYDTADLSSWTADSTSSTGTTTLAQLSGTPATITESPTGVYRIANPGGVDDLTFKLTATSGSAASANFTIKRAGAVPIPYRWTFQGGDAALMGNWK